MWEPSCGPNLRKISCRKLREENGGIRVRNRYDEVGRERDLAPKISRERE